jgi:ATP-dependent Clp protease ATP-binding subunit ClpB
LALDANRWTQKTQEAFSAAVADARGRNNPEVTPDHFLVALVGQEGTAVLPVLARVGVADLPFRNRVEEALAKLPHSYGGAGPELSRESREVLEQAEREREALGDEYLSVEHILLALAPRQSPGYEPEPRRKIPGIGKIRARPHR